VQRQPVRNVDETGWREKTKRMWLWISVTPVVTIFRLSQTRGAAGAKALLCDQVGGGIGTDHYAGYHWIEPRQRQLCWAHLKREFLAWSEQAGETARIGRALLAVEHQLFVLWYRVRDGTLPWASNSRSGGNRRKSDRAEEKSSAPSGRAGAFSWVEDESEDGKRSAAPAWPRLQTSDGANRRAALCTWAEEHHE